MRSQYLCIAAILTASFATDARLYSAQATSGHFGRADASPVLVINMRTYRWQLPEFRMAGREAFAIVEVENPHDYSLKVFVNCRTVDGRIPQMTGYYTIRPGEFLDMDTRRMREAMQNGDGVRVNCRFQADGSAKVKAWVYDRAKDDRAGGTPDG